MKGKRAAGPVQHVCVCYLLDLQVEGIEEPAACNPTEPLSLITSSMETDISGIEIVASS